MTDKEIMDESIKKRKRKEDLDSEPSTKIVRPSPHSIENQSAISLDDLSSDLVLLLYYYLNLQSIVQVNRLCSKWYHVYQAYEQSIWKNLSFRDWSLDVKGWPYSFPDSHLTDPKYQPNDPLCYPFQKEQDWKSIYGTHLNISRGKYRFLSLKENTCIPGKYSLSNGGLNLKPPNYTFNTVPPFTPPSTSTPISTPPISTLPCTSTPPSTLLNSSTSTLTAKPDLKSNLKSTPTSASNLKNKPILNPETYEYDNSRHHNFENKSRNEDFNERHSSSLYTKNAKYGGVSNPTGIASNQFSDDKKRNPNLIPELHINYISAWPANSSSSFLIALDGSYICWLDDKDEEQTKDVSEEDRFSSSTNLKKTLNKSTIYIQNLENMSKENNAWKRRSRKDKGRATVYDDIASLSSSTFPHSEEVLYSEVRLLEGHSSDVVLILSNKQNRLISYDVDSNIFIWDIERAICCRKICARLVK